MKNKKTIVLLIAAVAVTLAMCATTGCTVGGGAITRNAIAGCKGLSTSSARYEMVNWHIVDENTDSVRMWRALAPTDPTRYWRYDVIVYKTGKYALGIMDEDSTFRWFDVSASYVPPAIAAVNSTVVPPLQRACGK